MRRGYLELLPPAPLIQQMAQEGVQARAVRGVFPSVTYPSHTTLITGAVPERHGIYYNTPFEPEGQTGRWYWHTSAIRVPTLWDAVREAVTQVRALLARLPSETQRLFRVIERHELDRVGADPAVLLALSALPGPPPGSHGISRLGNGFSLRCSRIQHGN